MPWKSYKEESRRNWQYEAPDNAGMNPDQMKTGVLLRIADGVEAMAHRYTQLLDDVKYCRDRMRTLDSRCEHKDRQIRALRGVITKLRKAAAK